MTEEEIKALKDAKEKAETELAKANETIAEKERVIKVKDQDIIGARKEYQEKIRKVSELSEQEREALSEADIEVRKELERLSDEKDKLQQEISETRQKEVGARWQQAIKKRVGDNAEHAKQLEEHMKSFIGHDTASTEDEIASLADRGLNLFGDAKPSAINQAVNGNGEAPGGSGAGSNFAETEAGKGLAGVLNLDVAPVAPPAK